MDENPYQSPTSPAGPSGGGESELTDTERRKRRLAWTLVLLSLPPAIGAAFFGSCSVLLGVIFPARTFPFGMLAVGLACAVVAGLLLWRGLVVRRSARRSSIG